MWWLIDWRCGGSLVAFQTTKAVISGSNPASLTLENSEDRQSHCVHTGYTVKSLGKEGDLTSLLRPKRHLYTLQYETLDLYYPA